mmetsp:Transcript_102558/g.295305  ORF Transcript_102558/g.295305 Transcript_102558/m.295305 type:complete len:226 (+) Transcript_102558:962-1639(+)
MRFNWSRTCAKARAMRSFCSSSRAVSSRSSAMSWSRFLSFSSNSSTRAAFFRSSSFSVSSSTCLLRFGSSTTGGGVSTSCFFCEFFSCASKLLMRSFKLSMRFSAPTALCSVKANFSFNALISASCLSDFSWSPLLVRRSSSNSFMDFFKSACSSARLSSTTAFGGCTTGFSTTGFSFGPDSLLCLVAARRAWASAAAAFSLASFSFCSSFARSSSPLFNFISSS